MQTKQLSALRTHYKYALHKGIDSAPKLDPPMQITFERCISPTDRFRAITLSLNKTYEPGNQAPLQKSLLVLVQRLSAHYLGRGAKRPLLQSLFVLECPPRLLAASRGIAGDYHRHVHGLIEVPAGIAPDGFDGEIHATWKQSLFYAPGNNLLNEATDAIGWLKYISKRGSHDPMTNASTYNDILFESFRPRSL